MARTALAELEDKLLSSGDHRSWLLVVDDDEALRMLLVHVLEELGYHVLEASNGRAAMKLIWEHKDRLEAVVLDRNMPEMNGMNVVALMKESRELRWLPIIMETVADRPAEIQEAVVAGVFYYLTKPIDMEVLKTVVGVASRETRQYRALVNELTKHNPGFHCIETCQFRLRTLVEADAVAGLLANFFGDPERVIPGLAELIYNAIEHGNLAIAYDEKSKLIDEGIWRQEIMRRLELPEYKEKFVEVSFRREPQGCYVTVADQGKGFRWRDYMHIDPARAIDNHGRGIAQANMVNFDGLTYNDKGNQVTAFSANAANLEW
jgi:two-component system, cell cycle response regulator